jgi:hypothetical protein
MVAAGVAEWQVANGEWQSPVAIASGKSRVARLTRRSAPAYRDPASRAGMAVRKTMARTLLRPVAWVLRAPGSRRAIVVILGILALLFVAVQGHTSVLSRATVARNGPSVAESYHSLAALRADADIVVRGVAVGPVAVENVGGYQFTTIAIHVADVLSGSVRPRVLLVRQPGRAGALPAGDPPLLVPGQAYVLFLSRFANATANVAGQYVVTGSGAGEYADAGAALIRLDAGAIGLPATIPLGDMRRRL